MAESESGKPIRDTAELVGELKIDNTNNGIVITDGTVNFLVIDQNGILLNDGTNDRILIGKDESGF
jgi:hypothetical protein